MGYEGGFFAINMKRKREEERENEWKRANYILCVFFWKITSLFVSYGMGSGSFDRYVACHG